MEESKETDKEPEAALSCYQRLEDLLLENFPELIEDTNVERSPGDNPRNLRVFFDNGFMDIWISEEKYSFHWQSETEMARFDNAPHHNHLDTFPDHLHLNDELKETPVEGSIEEKLVAAIKYLEDKRLISD